MSKRWIVRHADPDLANSIAGSAKLPNLIASLLVGRGVDKTEDAQVFLNANLKENLRDPFLLPGCKAVAERLHRAIQEKKRIVVYGDYDVDGITGVAILRQSLRDLGADVHYYVPSRLDEGYGLNSEAIHRLKDDGTQLIITVDCGIASLEEADVANELGVELLITDHHHPGPILPNVVAIAHPQLVVLDGRVVSPFGLSDAEAGRAEKYPFPSLCGSTVALKVAWALGKLVANAPNVSSQFSNRLKQMVGLAVLGTVADIVPLLDENRAIVRGGLQYVLPPTASIGLEELLAVSGYIEGQSKVDTDFIAFQLAPRINAAGRLGQAVLAVELLITEDRERAKELAVYVDNLNSTRKSLELKITKEASAQVQDDFDKDDPAMVLCDADWHKGVIGIVAGRIAERFHKPAILLSKDKMRIAPAVGSARSVPGFDLYAALEDCSELLVRFGGHAAAAGLTIEEKNIDPFRMAFCEAVKRRITDEQRTGEIFLDGDFPLAAFTYQTVEQLSRLAPFGCANSRPVFSAHGVRIGNPRVFGKESNHFSAEFSQNDVSIQGIAYHKKEWLDEMQPFDQPIDIAFKVQINTFRGRSNVEMTIIDWKR